MSTVYTLDQLSTHELKSAIDTNLNTIVLLPIGSTEPHGPHLPLRTDVILAEENARRAAPLFPDDCVVFVAPALPYGVTDFAAGFTGAIGLSMKTFQAVISEIVSACLNDGFDHVALINHHLDPNHLKSMHKSLRQLTETFGTRRVSYPSVLDARWGRQLGSEFRSGACHAGAYEGSMVLAAEPELFRRAEAAKLPKLDLSLSEGIKNGVESFKALGMSESYTGDPNRSTAEFGHDLYTVMCDMVVTTVNEHLRSTHEN